MDTTTRTSEQKAADRIEVIANLLSIMTLVAMAAVYKGFIAVTGAWALYAISLVVAAAYLYLALYRRQIACENWWPPLLRSILWLATGALWLMVSA